MAGDNVRWEGLREFDAALKDLIGALDKRDAKTVLRQSLREGGKIIQKDIRANAKSSIYRIGNKLAKASGIKNARDSEGNIAIKIYFRRKNHPAGYLAHIFEGGAYRAKRGTIKPGRFVERAERSKANEAMNKVGDVLLDKIEKMVRRRLKK